MLSKLLAPVRRKLDNVLPVDLTEYMAACDLQNHHVYDQFKPSLENIFGPKALVAKYLGMDQASG